jgi:hypothetical protein
VTILNSGDDQTVAGIGDEWRAGVAYEGNRVSVREAFEEIGGPGGFIVVVIANQRLADLEVFEQFLGLAGIFAGDQGNFVAQNLDGSKSNIVEIADRGSDDIEGSRQNDRIVSLDLTDLPTSTCRHALKHRMPV